MIHGRNFIAAAWREGVAEIEDVNPFDVTDRVGRFAQAAPGDVHLAVEAAREAQAR